MIGDTHGGAIEQAAKIMQEWIVQNDGKSADEIAGLLMAWLKETKKRMPGFGHRLHKIDPRTAKLFEIAARHGYSGKHIELCKALEKTLEQKLGKALPINVDGAIAAVISDMGFDWRLGKGFFIISRVPGLLAHGNIGGQPLLEWPATLSVARHSITEKLNRGYDTLRQSDRMRFGPSLRSEHLRHDNGVGLGVKV